MVKCEFCDKESEHIIPCAMCGKKMCPSCAHHLKDKYLCADCLKQVYKHPVRDEKKVPEVEEPPAKDTISKTTMKFPVVQAAALVLLAAFLMFGFVFISQPGASNITENESVEVALPEIVILRNDTLNVYPHMRSYLDVTNYSVVCENGTVTQLDISFKTGALSITFTSIELFEKEVLGDFSPKALPANTVTVAKFTNLQKYAQIDQYNTTTIELIFVANRGVYQKAIITPNPRLCQH